MLLEYGTVLKIEMTVEEGFLRQPLRSCQHSRALPWWCGTQPSVQPVVCSWPVISELGWDWVWKSFLQPSGGRFDAATLALPCGSAERSLQGKQHLCFRFPVGVKAYWAHNACHCTLPAAGSLGCWEAATRVIKGFMCQRAKPLDEPVYLVARKGTLSRELIQK